MKTTMFKDEMLQAVLELIKTQTRRLIKLKDFRISDTEGYDFSFRDKRMLWNEMTKSRLIEKKCPYQVGDIVGIKENFEILEYQLEKVVIKYLLDDETDCKKLTIKEVKKFFKWKNKLGNKSKLFMFDSLIRKKIQITDIRVEIINDISEDDCIKEGVEFVEGYDYQISQKHIGYFEHPNKTIAIFLRLWNSINEKRGYGSGTFPWVFVYGFKLI